MTTLREKLAAYAHNAWSGWMIHQFSKLEHRTEHGLSEGAYLPKALRDRWTRQMNTEYADLSEEEKESDRAKADTILAILGIDGTNAEGGEPQGLYHKYIVLKADGSPVAPEAQYLVLRMDADIEARKAARFYANLIRMDNEELARDLYDWANRLEALYRERERANQ